jgi:mannose/fructose/N-acetylgalactosamine-specific phosphotransferase system component IIB
MASEIENTIKASFSRVKEHMDTLEAEIKANREFIISQNKHIESQNERIMVLQTEINSQKSLLEGQIKVQNVQIQGNKTESKQITSLFSLERSNSNRNRGVQSINHSTINQSLNSQSLDVHAFSDNLPAILSKVSRQEFLTFLMVYQLEDQIGQVTYADIAKGLELTASCVRSYISNLIKKGLPIVKKRYNNKITVLSIPKEIRGLNLKKQIINTFYQIDPTQKKLGEDF